MIFALCPKRGAVLADVQSANIVGYSTFEVRNKKQTAFALVYQDVAEGAKDIAVDKLVNYGAFVPKTAGAFGNAADQIWYWDVAENTWHKYYYHKKTNEETRWRRCDTRTTPYTYSELTPNDKVQAGQTFMFYNGASTNITLTFSGEVKPLSEDASFTIANKKQQFIAYPWPVELPISDITKYYGAFIPKSAGAFGNAADQVWRWDVTNNTWFKYYYHKKTNEETRWRRCDTRTTPYTYSELTVDDKVPAGQGFVFYNGASTNVTLRFSFKQ